MEMGQDPEGLKHKVLIQKNGKKKKKTQKNYSLTLKASCISPSLLEFQNRNMESFPRIEKPAFERLDVWCKWEIVRGRKGKEKTVLVNSSNERKNSSRHIRPWRPT